MTSVALLVGNAVYRAMDELACCRNDVTAMEELLAATGKYDEIAVTIDSTGDQLRSKLRAVVDGLVSAEEIFFYFSGHGDVRAGEFYYCMSDYDRAQPNRSGISESELLDLLRPTGADLVVMVVDACHSGARLIKADRAGAGLGLPADAKGGFRGLLKIASCLEFQTSPTGDPLSPFTNQFRAAALQKRDGPVYFTDVINGLRDAYLADEEQVPIFTSQTTGREIFVKDAGHLEPLRKKVAAAAAARSVDAAAQEMSAPDAETIVGPPSLINLLRAAEARVATPERVAAFVDRLFGRLAARVSEGELAELFDTEIVEHGGYEEPTAREFMVRVLTREDRQDRFVHAEVVRRAKRRDRFSILGYAGLSALTDLDPDAVERYDLHLNCAMKKAQIRVNLTPKFAALQRLSLVVSCAPSLERCYVFETVTGHRLEDFGRYGLLGAEVVRRWYKLAWSDATDALADSFAAGLLAVARAQVASVESRLRTGEAPQL